MATRSIAGSGEGVPQGSSYFSVALDALAGDAGMDLTAWPRDIKVRGHDMSKLERSVSGLSALVELIHAHSLNQDALDGGHADARLVLSDHMVDRLHHAAGVLAWDSALLLATIRERAQESEK